MDYDTFYLDKSLDTDLKKLVDKIVDTHQLKDKIKLEIGKTNDIEKAKEWIFERVKREVEKEIVYAVKTIETYQKVEKCISLMSNPFLKKMSTDMHKMNLQSNNLL